MELPDPRDCATVTRLDSNGPFCVGPALSLLAAGAVPGLEQVDRGTARVTRFLAIARSGPVRVVIELADDHALLGHARTDPVQSVDIVRTVRRWLDLDADPAHIAAVLGPDPLLGPLVTARPGIRVLGYPDGFEGAVLSVLGQHVSVTAARTFGGRLIAGYGTAVPGEPSLRCFPTPAALAAASPTALQAAVGVTSGRARTVHALATACAEGLSITPDVDQDVLRARLLAVPGIGPWTVAHLAVRALGDRDAYPAGDLVLRRALGVETAAEATAAAAGWSPYRAYGLFHLWCAALGI